MTSRAAVFTCYGESRSKKLTGTLILLMFSLQNTYGGSIQRFLDSMVDEGFPRFKVPEEIDRKFDEEVNNLLTRSKYSFRVDKGSGLPFLECKKSEDSDYWDPNNYRLASTNEKEVKYKRNKFFRN